ncbi:MAG TPA: hypothetical protein VK838_06870 [Candidatus Limnocylindrales bacterium]|nr:hypothetical protein [Candidatus Limnocylindrales bacterium]
MHRPLVVAILLVGLLAACGAPTGTGLSLSDGSGARIWGNGSYGLVLVPDAGRDATSWDSVAPTFAGDGMTVLAVDSANAAAVVAALRYLRQERGVARAALLGAGAGADAALAVAGDQRGLVDQLIVLSASGDVSGLGEMPKLFVASTGEPAAAEAQRMSTEAAGAWNELYLAEGSDSGQAILEGDGRAGTMAAILRRLDERR